MSRAAIKVLLAVAIGSATVAGQTATPRAVPYFSEPSLSPDRSEIAFTSGGDIWTVPSAGGSARLLISHPATEARPLFSPDGRSLAFTSTRDGNPEIYVLALESGDIRRLTFDDSSEQLDAWSHDGRWLYYSSSSRDIGSMNDVYRIGATGGTPMPVAADRYVSEYFSSPSPDGTSLALTARGVAAAQWWRKGHSHIDESEVWLLHDGAPARYEAVTNGGAKDMWPMWASDGRSLYFVSDRGGTQNIWLRPAGEKTPRQVTRFKDGRVLWPTISRDGRQVVFEHDFEIWSLDTASDAAQRVPITKRGTPSGPGTRHQSLTEQFQELALSPDGRKIAFAALGDIFAASSRDGGDAVRVTTTPDNEFHVTWSPDSRKVAYASSRDGVSHLYLFDFASGVETRLTDGAAADHSPRFSPDGKTLAFVRGDNELRGIDLSSKQETRIASGLFQRPPNGRSAIAWSPDGRSLAYATLDADLFRNIFVVPRDGGEPRPISFLANAFGSSVSWSPDGTFLLFDTGQRTETRKLARVELILRTPRFREDQFRDLFRDEPSRPAAGGRGAEPRDAAATAGPSVPRPNIVFDGIRQRLTLLPVGVDTISQTISPDSRSILLVAQAAGQQNLYVFPLDPLSRTPPISRQLTSTPGFKSFAQFSPDGREVYFLEQGRINAITVETRQTRRIAVTAETDVDFDQQKIAVFRQGWSYLRDNFFDASFNGVDWDRVRTEYEPRIAGAATADEMRRLMTLMVGELNASHMNVSAPANPQSTAGKLGLRFDRGEYERTGSLTITEAIPLGPAAVVGIVPGERLIAVDGSEIGPGVNLDQLLNHKVSDRTVLTIAAAGDKTRREVPVQPVSTAAEKNLLYRAWVEGNRSYVAAHSGGRLGYVHMFDMSEEALEQLNLDLDIENRGRDGVVIDVRNNNGGFVNAYAIDVFARRDYLSIAPRGRVAAPARSWLGQRSLGLPTVLVTNQHSLSDAEDFTEGYRSLKLGKVVGEPTAGWIIYTSNFSLLDGTVLRIPGSKVFASDGTPMELHPRPVDVLVKRPVGESLSGRDSQLDAAVQELLKQLGTAPRK